MTTAKLLGYYGLYGEPESGNLLLVPASTGEALFCVFCGQQFPDCDELLRHCIECQEYREQCA